MRHALVSLIAASAAAAVSVSALAQETTTPEMTPPPATLPAPPPTVEPATPETATPPAPAPHVEPSPVVIAAPPAPPATPAVPDLPTPEVAPAPAVEVPPAPPAPPPAPVVEAPPPAPAVPTDPTTLRVLNVLENVCKPLVQGGDVQALTRPMGFKKKRDALTLALTKPYAITLTHSATNKNVCMVEIDHSIAGDKPITVGLHDWAIARGYTLYRNDEFTTDMKRHTRSWELVSGDKTEALVLTTTRKADGSPMSRNADRSTLMYSVR